MNIYILDLKVQTYKKVILPQCKRRPLLVTTIASNIKKKKDYFMFTEQICFLITLYIS
jgi:hypothetical protein